MEGFPFYPWPQDLSPVGGVLEWAAGAQPDWWELPQAGVWPVVWELGDPSSSIIVVVQLGPVVLWESCCSHLLVVNWFFFSCCSGEGRWKISVGSFFLLKVDLACPSSHSVFARPGNNIKVAWLFWELCLWLWAFCRGCAQVMVHFHFSPSAGCVHEQVFRDGDFQ